MTCIVLGMVLNTLHAYTHLILSVSYNAITIIIIIIITISITTPILQMKKVYTEKLSNLPKLI